MIDLKGLVAVIRTRKKNTNDPWRNLIAYDSRKMAERNLIALQHATDHPDEFEVQDVG